MAKYFKQEMPDLRNTGKKKFYFRGKKIRVKADKDGKYKLSLKVGDAVFVEMKK